MSHRSLVLGLALLTTCSLQSDWRGEIASLRPGNSSEAARMVLDNLERRAAQSLGRLSRAVDLRGCQELQASLRPRLRQALGLDRFPWPPELNVRRAGVLEYPDHRIEKIVYETLPGIPVPAHVYLPKGLTGRAPAIVFYPGHWLPDSKSRPDFQAFCINMARLGFVVLTFDPFGQGERGMSWRDHRRTSSLLVGIAQQGFAAHETRCAIEYLLSRQEVDHKRIGITGASGGGYNSWITGAIDDRVSAVVPVVGTSDFLEQIKVCRPLDWYQAKEHCHFVPGLIRHANNHEFIALIAPRPLMIIAASEDQSFPIAGVREVATYGRKLYSTLGQSDRIGFFEDPSSGHGYQQAKREAAYGWFLKSMQGRGGGQPFPEPPTETLPFDSPELRCFEPGQNESAGPGMERFVETLAEQTRTPANLPNLENLLGELPQPLENRLEVAHPGWGRLEIQSEADLKVPGFLFSPKDPRGLLVAVDDRGKESALTDPLIEHAVARGWAVSGIDPRFLGELSVEEMGWASATALLLGENLVWHQAWDVRIAVEALRRTSLFQNLPLVLYGRGDNAALVATYAIAQLHGSSLGPVSRFVIRDGFLTFRHFIGRPASMQESFRLQAATDESAPELDREIPFRYFVFDSLRKFDLPQLLSSTGIPGTLIDPIDGDWAAIPVEDARRIAGSTVRVVSSADLRSNVLDALLEPGD